MQTFLEYFASPEQHPLHNAAVKAGFNHESTSSAANAATHEYSHPKGHSLTLHTGSGGNHSYTMKTKSGKTLTGTTPGHFFGASLHV